MLERLGVHATKPQQMCKVIWLREALCVLRPERRIRRDFWELEPSRLCLSIAWTLPASLRKDLCVYVCDCACMSACVCMCVRASTAKEGANNYGSISKSIPRFNVSGSGAPDSVDTGHCSQASLASQSSLPGGLPGRFPARRAGTICRDISTGIVFF